MTATRWVHGPTALERMRGTGGEAKLGTVEGTTLHEPAKRTRDLCIMACVFCKDPQFHAWLTSLDPFSDTFNEAGAKAFILNLCQVSSRNELDTDAAAALRFHQLVREPFLAWKEPP